MKDLKVLAGIVTYNPDEKRLRENLTELVKQVSDILIIDNGSKKIRTIIEHIPQDLTEHISVIYLKKNMGIAKALADIMIYAREKRYDWVLTLDQDSILEPGLILQYKKNALLEINKTVGMFTCLICDRNFCDKKYETQKTEYVDVKYCITSAAFTNVEKYFETSGYDKSFFIDCVDFDICYLLREKGYKIRRINYTGLCHEVGHGENRKFLGRNIVVYHQAPFRIYYLTRNTIWMYKKHKGNFSFFIMLKKLIALFIRVILYEDRKAEKLIKIFLGIRDSKRYGETHL